MRAATKRVVAVVKEKKGGSTKVQVTRRTYVCNYRAFSSQRARVDHRLSADLLATTVLE